MALGMIHRLIDVLKSVFRDLKVQASNREVEKIVLLIHRCMSFQARQFHTLEHVFGFLDGADATTALAAVFHDLIYYQVDLGIQDEIQDLIAPYLTATDQGMALQASIPAQDKAFHVTRRIFGFESGQNLAPFSGLNEFLSALLMVKLLEHQLKPLDLWSVCVCIEATIPFRGPDSQGRGPMEVLEGRLRELDREGLASFPPGELQKILHRAVDFANKDVSDFCLEDSGRFLNNTWKLLPELNSSLRTQGSYGIVEYRQALQKMDGFFGFLRPENVYHAWDGVPAPEAMADLTRRVKKNLGIAREYLQAKLLAVGFLEAAAQLTGGDGPLALFMGDIPRGGETPERLEDYLPVQAAPPWLDISGPVYNLLKTGRMEESSFDLKNSPLALFLYQRLKPDEFAEKVTQATEFFSGRRTADSFLQAWDVQTRETVLVACSRLVLTRAEEWEAWMGSHP